MTLELLKEIAQQMRDDNPEATGQMTAAGRSAAKAIRALADAMDKVADSAVVGERTLVAYDDFHQTYRCKLCGLIITNADLSHAENQYRIGVLGRDLANTEDVARHFGTTHPRHFDIAMKEINA